MYSIKSFYRSDDWQNLLKLLKTERVNENGDLLCEHCGQPIVRKYDCIGHHIIELTEANVNDFSISLNPENIKLVHHACHNRIHERFGYHDQKVYIVYGSPCSGKSTWVDDVANKDDLIVDIDRLWECMCNSDRYHKPKRLKANAFGLRDTMIEMIKQRKGMWRNAYYVATLPLASDRERMRDMLGAELIFIDTDRDTCLERCVNDEWKEYVQDWFENYT